jgi:hypothetical protein
MPATRAKLKQLAVDPMPLNPAEMDAFVARETHPAGGRRGPPSRITIAILARVSYWRKQEGPAQPANSTSQSKGRAKQVVSFSA